MNRLTALHEALLEIGLEDLIALAHIQGSQEVRALAQHQQGLDAISKALVDLLKLGRIQVWAGQWAEEPRIVGEDVAEGILRDLRRYSFEAEQEGLDRVYFANVDNVRG